MYENNLEALKKIVEEHAVIRHVSKHRKPDGSFDIEGNRKIWNDALDRLELMQLWEDGAPGYDPAVDPLQREPAMAFIPGGKGGGPRGTVIVAPGGGFETMTGCEGMNVALRFAEAGFNTAVLSYRLKLYTRYDALADMQRAIRLLRSRKDRLGITDRVAVMGFSAGGMLGGNAATHYDAGSPEAEDPAERESCRPDAAVIAYGAFAFSTYPQGFLGFFHNPFVKNREELYYFAPEANITPDTPPMFIWQTNSDDPRHSMALGSALQQAGVEFEMHLFPQGVHGLGLADGENDLGMKIPHVARWAELCAEWLEEHGI